MALNDVRLFASDGNLNRKNPGMDGVSGFITNGIATAGLVLGTSYQINSPQDLAARELDAAYDTTNNVLVYHHCREYLRTSLSGSLWLMVVPQTVTLAQMADVANAAYIRKLALDSKGTVRQYGIGRCPVVGYTPTTTGGMDTDAFAAVPKAAQMVQYLWNAHRPAVILIEGRSFTGTVTAATDLRTLNSPGVAVTILQDKAVASTHAIHSGYAAIGSSLGLLSRRRVNESVMWVEPGNIQSVADGRFLTDVANNNLCLSSGLTVDSYVDIDPNTGEDIGLGTLQDKGYWFGRTYTDYAGVYMVDSAACMAANSDYAYIENSRTIQKAARLIYKKVIRDLGKPTEVDAETGFLDIEVIKDFQTKADDSLDEMSGEISGREVYVEPEQDIISTSELLFELTVTPTGTRRKIKGTLKFNNPFNS